MFFRGDVRMRVCHTSGGGGGSGIGRTTPVAYITMFSRAKRLIGRLMFNTRQNDWQIVMRKREKKKEEQQ